MLSDYKWHVMKCENITLMIKLMPQDEKIKNRKNVMQVSEQKIITFNLLHDLLHGVDSTMCKQSIVSC